MDFLSRLGARAVGAPSSVKPIIPPLFQARTPVSGISADEGADERMIPAKRVAEGRIRPRPDGPDTLVEASDDPGKAHLHLPIADEDGPTRGELGSTRDATQAGMPRRTSIERFEDGRARPAESASPAGRHQPVTAISPQPGDVLRHDAAIESEPVKTLPTASESTPLVPREARMPDVAAALERLRALREAVAAPRTRRDPVVRVSIGRIEVRSVPAVAPEQAVAPPPAVQPARALTPRVTLADYLARKQGAR
jgi:hypothetical protein